MGKGNVSVDKTNIVPSFDSRKMSPISWLNGYSSFVVITIAFDSQADKNCIE